MVSDIRRLTSLFLFLLFIKFSLAQADTSSLSQVDSIRQRVFLIGDAGALQGDTHPVIDWLAKNVNWDDERNLVLFLGDNIYPYGMPFKGEASYPLSKKIIDYQISLVKGKKAQAYFIPGNHDWKNGKIGGWEQVKNEVDYINSQELKNVEAWPIDGCPGPVEIKLSDSIVLVLMDSQWWLHLHEKPGVESQCEYKTEDQVITALQEISDSHKDQLMIVAMHHPLYSYGVHGGNYTWKSHIFPFVEAIPWLYIPLPLLGSIYPITRGIFGNIQDVKHPMYRTMINQVEGVLKNHRNVIHVSGHDHALQMLMKDSVPYMVAGAGAEISRVKTGDRTLFASATYGFGLIEVRKSGKVEAKMYTLASDNLNDPAFAKQLKTIVKDEPLAPYTRVVALPDSVTVAANPDLKGTWFKNLMFGENYRKEWTQPIKVKVFDISKANGGMVPTKRGGGKQTKSLRLEDSTGKEYSLRSIQKFPAPAIPAELRETIAKDIVAQGISASYPYAALSVAPISQAADVPHLEDVLVYVADDTLLGRFREEFANTLCMLEEREPSFTTKTYNTEEVALRLFKDNDDHINQKKVLKARILDMYIMDFDRHEDQWRWYTTDTGKGKIYNPIPKDRDQAFFTNQGLIPAYAKQRSLVPDIQGLRPQAFNIKTFNKSARNFDRFFLNELNKKDWELAIDTFLMAMTDSVIEVSLAMQPEEVRNYNAPEIVRILKERRKYLKSDLLKYYDFISKVVNVLGTNKKELFTIDRNDDGSVHVVVNKLDKENDVSSTIYDRLFDPAVTKEIRIYGLENDDRFIFSGNNNAIKVRIIGGAGDDEFISKGDNNRTAVYDASFEKNVFSGNNNYRNKVSDDPTVNQYDRLYYKYNIFNLLFSAAYNRDDGIFLGAGFTYTGHGFRKSPYASRHQLAITHALATQAYNIKYNADFIKLIGNTDLLVRSDIKAPINVKNFFGIGNGTFYDKSRPGEFRYYRTRYNLADASVLLRKTLQSWMNVSYGAIFQYYNLDSAQNRDKFINNFAINGQDPETVAKRKTYLGAVVNLDIDSRNNKVIPSRGANISLSGRTMWGLNKAAQSNLTRFDADLGIFISLVENSKTVFATRFGYGKNIGHYEFFQAQYLGGNTNLRGFPNNRFAGRSMFFNNSEIRFRIADFKTYLFPGAFGLIVFNDVGRVWANEKSSKEWHYGYGAGLYLSPLRRFVIAGYYTRSSEGAFPLVTFGFQF